MKQEKTISHRLRSVGFVHIEGSDAYDPAGGAAAIVPAPYSEYNEKLNNDKEDDAYDKLHVNMSSDESVKEKAFAEIKELMR